MLAALRNSVAVAPVSLSFGAGLGAVDAAQQFTITNLGTAEDTFTLAFSPAGSGPATSLDTTSVRLPPGGSRQIVARFTGAALAAGEYQGALHIHGTLRRWIPSFPIGMECAMAFRNTSPNWLGRTWPPPAHSKTSSFASPTAAECRRGVIPTVRRWASGSVLSLASVDDLSRESSTPSDVGPVRRANVFEIDAGAVTLRISIQGVNQ